jgi:RNA polymerase sigma-32 factor
MTLRIATQGRPAVEAGLRRYIDKLHRFPLLTAEDERRLAERCRERRDADAAERLVTSHLRYVAKIAAGYRGYGLPLAELISEGNIGLIEAVRRFDPARGCRLSTYAVWWIKAAINDYILRSWSMVRIGTTEAQRRLFFKLRQAKSSIAALEDGDLRPDHVAAIAQRLHVSGADVIEMNRRLAGDVALNAPARAGEDSAGEALDRLSDDAPSPEHIVLENEQLACRRRALNEALRVLDARERRIIAARWLGDATATFEELAAQLGVSRERVRQIEVRAFDKVRKDMKRRLAAPRATPPATVH